MSTRYEKLPDNSSSKGEEQSKPLAGVSWMDFYGPLFSQACRISAEWIVSSSLASKTIIGAITTLVIGVVTWRRGIGTAAHVAWGLGSFLLAMLVVSGGIFLISLLCYAPGTVLWDVTNQVAIEARKQAEQNHQAEEAALAKKVTQLQEQVRSNPMNRMLVRAEAERDSANERARRAEDFVRSITDDVQQVDNAQQAFEDAADKQQQELRAFVEFGTGMDLKPGVTPEAALAQERHYYLSKSDTDAAKAKLHKKLEALRSRLDQGF